MKWIVIGFIAYFAFLNLPSAVREYQTGQVKIECVKAQQEAAKAHLQPQACGVEK